MPANRLAHGYRWEDEQWKEEPQLPDGAFGAMGGMLTSIRDLGRYVAAFVVRVAATRWSGDGADQALVAARDAADLAAAADDGRRARGNGATQLNAGGYGFGLGISETCTFGHIVAHSGGLPGFGSQMRWLPEYGVGLIAMGNRTYTGWGGVFTSALELLRQDRWSTAPDAAPSPALVEARDAVSRLVVAVGRCAGRSHRGGEPVLGSLEGSPPPRDRSAARQSRRVSSPTEHSPTSRTPCADRGGWSASAERSRVSITLAPTMPPTVQFLEVGPAAVPARATCAP